MAGIDVLDCLRFTIALRFCVAAYIEFFPCASLYFPVSILFFNSSLSPSVFEARSILLNGIGADGDAINNA